MDLINWLQLGSNWRGFWEHGNGPVGSVTAGDTFTDWMASTCQGRSSP